METRTGPLRIFLALVLLALAAVALWTGFTAVVHLWQPVYRQTPTRLVVTLAACAAILAGARLLWERRHPGLTLGGLFAPLLWVLTLIGAASIGVFVFPVAVAVSVLVITASVRAGGGAGGAAAIGAVIAISLGVLLFAQPWTPAVECGEHSVSTTGRPFDGNSGSGMSSSGSGTGIDPDKPTESTGNLSFGDESYVYRCRGAELVEFRRVG